MKKITKQIIEELREKKQEVVIYGAGGVAKVVLEKFLRMGISVKGIAVTSLENNPYYILGKQVQNMEDVLNQNTGKPIIVCVLEEKQHEIERKLNTFKNEIIYFMDDALYYEWRKDGFAEPVSNDYEIHYHKRYIDPYLQTLAEVCAEYGVDKEAAKRYVNNGMEVIKKENEVHLPRLVVVLSSKCSLRCRDCNNLMPHFKPQKDLDADIIIESLKKITERVGSVLKCELIGGEPFLAQNLRKVLDYIICNKVIKTIEITTNGTILPNSNCIPLLQNTKVIVRISDYGTVINQEKVIHFLQQHGIRYEVLQLGNWISPGGVCKRNKDILELKKNYAKCSSGYFCKTLYEDKIFACARAASLATLGYMKENEYVQIGEKLNIKELKKFLLMDYSAACDYCDMADDEKIYVEPAVQLGR